MRAAPILRGSRPGSSDLPTAQRFPLAAGGKRAPPPSTLQITFGYSALLSRERIPRLGESVLEMVRQMAPAMTGRQTAAAEIAKITAMRTHDHQSLSANSAAVATLAFLRESTRLTFATAILPGMTCEKNWAHRRLAWIPEMGDFGRLRALRRSSRRPQRGGALGRLQRGGVAMLQKRNQR